jgi:predicted nucleic-acid-binding Zn-ribbon protein
MQNKKTKSINKNNKSKLSKKSKTNTIQKGGRTEITNPSVKYTKGNAPSKKLTCTKCDNTSFIVKTLTMGTKTKAFLDWEILDNRFKVFTCKSCGFVQIYSNSIKCGGRDCD